MFQLRKTKNHYGQVFNNSDKQTCFQNTLAGNYGSYYFCSHQYNYPNAVSRMYDVSLEFDGKKSALN